MGSVFRASVLAAVAILASACGGSSASVQAPPPVRHSWPAGQATYSIVGADGAAVGEARVVAYADDITRPALRLNGSLEEDVSEASGTSGSIDLPVGSAVAHLFVEAPGHSPRVVTGVRRGDTITIALRRPRHFAGTVRDEHGALVAGASVRWLIALDACVVERVAVTDASGRYDIGDVPSGEDLAESTSAGRWLLTVEVEDALRLIRTSDVFEDAAPAVVEHELRLSEPVFLRGRVAGAPGGAALGGVRMELHGDPLLGYVARPNGIGMRDVGPTGALTTTISAADGEYRLGPVPALQSWDPSGYASYRVEAHPPEGHRAAYEDVFSQLSARTDFLLSAGNGEMEEQTPFDRLHCGTLPGTPTTTSDAAADLLIVDSAGRPISGASVSKTARLSRWRSGPDGRLRVFTWRKIGESAAPFRRIIRAAGYASIESPPIEADPDDPPQTTVVLAAPIPLTGRVVATTGRPVVGARVTARPRGSKLTEPVSEVRSGPGGVFTFTDLGDGPWSLRARAIVPKVEATNGIGSVEAVVHGVTAADSPRLEIPDDGRGDLRLRVVDGTDGTAPNVVAARLRAWNVRTARGRQTAPGAVDFRGAPSGSYTLHLTSPGYVPETLTDVRVVAGETLTLPVVRLRRGATLAGRLRLPPGTSPGDSVTARRIGGGCNAVGEVSPDGAFRVTGLAAGDYELRVNARTDEVRAGTRFDGEHVSAGVRAITVATDQSVGDLDVAVVPVHSVILSLKTERLPWENGTEATISVELADEMRRWRLEIVNDLGTVVWALSDLRAWNYRTVTLPVGTYTARAVIPGEDAREMVFSVTGTGTDAPRVAFEIE